MRGTIFLLLLTACGPDIFTSVGDSGKNPEGSSPLDAQVSETSTGDGGLDARDSGGDSSIGCSDSNDVEHDGHCYYLDGSKGVCDQGYTISSNAKLALVLAANPNAWQGKTYRHTVSDNCCVLTKDSVENYGMVSNINMAGPFDAGEPVLGSSGCTMKTNLWNKQLTLCESQ